MPRKRITSVETPKGRPRLQEDRHLPDMLLDVTKHQLHGKSHLELTSREIAEAAGTSVSMINYYFQSKDGLIVELVNAISNASNARLRGIESDIDRGVDDPTAHIVRVQVESMKSNLDVLSIAFIELLRPDSQMKRLYSQKSQIRGGHYLERMEKIIRKLIDKGIYRHDLDPALSAWLFMSLFYGPLLVRAFWEANGSNTKPPETEAWIDNVTDMLRRMLSAPAAANDAPGARKAALKPPRKNGAKNQKSSA